MKRKILLINLFLITGLVFATIIACDKNDDPVEYGHNAGNMKDLDGNVYKTVAIGTQVWMAENLKTTQYNDGIKIKYVTSDTEWMNLSVGAYCNYDNNESNVATYGKLYNWYAVITNKLAPDGWHVPTDEDWTILENYLIANGFNYDGSKEENKIAKSLASTIGWPIFYATGTPGADTKKNNRSGFTALPGGYRSNFGVFVGIGEKLYWWSSTEGDYNGIYTRSLGYDYLELYRNVGSSKECGFSVRLVKNN
jgi:uncharacterized protein (TIGR02145 family)